MENTELNSLKRTKSITLPALDTLQRNVQPVPIFFNRKPKEVPFHLPHRKLLDKIEYVKQPPEPLTGFAQAQVDRYHREKKSLYKLDPLADVARKKQIRIYVEPSEPEFVPTVTDPLKMKPEVTAQKDVIDYIRAHPEKGFLYMIYAVPPENVYFTPYYLKVVPYDSIVKNNYLTISPCGVTHYTNEMVFTNLNDWEQEYTIFMKLTDIKFFKVYRYWKAFYVWRKSIIFRKYSKLRARIKKNLFILTPVLGKALLDIQAMVCEMYMKSFADLTRDMDTAFFYFIETQFKQVDYIHQKLEEYRNVVLEVIQQACHTALFNQGFTFDDRYVPPFQVIRGKPTGGMTYTEKANKRKYCERLACFIKLTDYITNYMLYRLTKRSNYMMAGMLHTHVEFTPSKELLEGHTVEEVLEVIPRPVENCKWALFQVDAYVLPSGEMTLTPSAEIIATYMEKVTNFWDQYVREFHNYLNDESLQIFIQPTIMGKQVEWSAGESPNLYFLMNQDKKMLDEIAYIHFAHMNAFECVKIFLKRMEPFMEHYKEACEMDVESIKRERELPVFKVLCDKLMKQMESIEEVVSYQPLGIIFLNLSPFQELFRPQPRRLYDVVVAITPDIGRECIDEVVSGIEAISEDITKEPITSAELVEFNYMLDGLEPRIAKLEERLEYLRELYDLMGEFNCPIPPDDMNEFMGLSVQLGTLRTNVDARLETRGKLAGMFASQIGKDIMDLMMEVNELREELESPWFCDESSDMEKVLEALGELGTKLQACAARDKQIREWQKIFKIPPARLETLDETLNNVKLKQSLWKSSKEWMDLYESWNEVPFNTLDVDEIQNTTINFGKIFNQLDKGLPPNKIVPKCKRTIDLIKEKLPVIGYLRTPALRPRHWVRIEEILKTRFKPEVVMTLKMFEELGVFKHADELMEVAGQASSEASLEALLKKVEEMWAALEFPVVLHKDARDVYILGGLDEIIATLDESNIHVSTILSSRNCGPIKSRVEEWSKNLDLFSKTLEEWQQCQQTWIYLEVIFSAPDIQRQLPNETRLFLMVDKSWKDIMRRVFKVPLALPAGTVPGLYEEFVRNNEMLEQIMKCLEAYLETKRVAFPRFFFLSNDELLEILAQTRNPHAVQPHLRKCFDAIAKLEFGVKMPDTEMVMGEDGTMIEREMSFDTKDELQARLAKDATPEQLTTDIIAMLSPEQERVNLGKGLKARGNVEDWLGKVEEAMFASVKRCLKHSLRDYLTKPRVEWVKLHPNQVVLAVSQTMWAKGVHEILELEGVVRIDLGLINYEKKCISDLNDLASLTREDLSSLFRKILCALITVDVHARDTISNMVAKQVRRANDFEWLKMIRYYWDEDIDNCVCRMSSAKYVYGYEYLGAGGVLVITPLTDRCYLCLMGALQLDLGGAPAGPAGTGKTETTKDLAKSVAIQCVVFNCSEGLDYKMMGRFFSGLATSGAWCCFDEFNRIDIEVLSVIAQQLITIRNAKVARAARFMFEGREIKLVRSCAAFITMNPGYAGRTELPDNLKALFRPISMMVPDYALIAEVILYSEGFESSRGLAKKMVQMYKLSSEQLSKQDHYDFGMRAVKSVLVMAGALKRAHPDQPEEMTLLCALNDSNLPKFLAADAILFAGILSDLFPGVHLPVRDYALMEETIELILRERKLQVEACQIRKIIQLHETMIVRWGVMTVGPTGGGKTVVLHTLGNVYARMHENGVAGPFYYPVHKYIMNPKCLSIGELYGEVNLQTLEWHDGILPLSLRTAVQFTTPDHQWLICDGPVDAVWIENMNTVLDDNKMLCLANSERIKLTPYVHMLFEVADLAQASPATVSRCGMVYVDPNELGFLPYVRTWLEEGVEKNLFNQENSEFLYELFKLVGTIIDYVNEKCRVAINQVNISKANALCSMMGALLSEPGERFSDKYAVKTYIAHCFIFSYVWAVGGNIFEMNRRPFEELIKRQFEEFEEAEYFPAGFNFFDMFMDTKQRKLKVWAEIIPTFIYDPNKPFFETLVPTIDTVRYGYMFEKLLGNNKPVMFTGNTGVGKTVVADGVLKKMALTEKFVPVIMNFSAQTSSQRTQEVIELRLEKRPRKALGAPLGKKVIIFIDDVNMPKLDIYGSQPTIELLRQFLDFGGFYDRDKLYWKDILDVVLSCGCAPPGGGRNPLTARFTRHFAMFLLSPPNADAMKTIFKSILQGHMEDFVSEVSVLGEPIVNAAVEIYLKICSELLPTPAKSHYVFNLRDLSKTMQGVLQADAGYMRNPDTMLRLFFHECMRVFHDRLINVKDKSYFLHLMASTCKKNFGSPILDIPEIEPIIEHPPILLFGDFINSATPKESRVYDEFTDVKKLTVVLKEYLEEYNSTARAPMHLQLFKDCMEHIVRVARVFRAERGHCLLVGPGGSGRRSVATLAGHVNECKCMGMELKRQYDTPEFHEDLRKMYLRAGLHNDDIVFLFTDTQITKENFLEDINNMLNSGEVPNMFDGDTYEQVQNESRADAGKAGINTADRDAVYFFFINRVRTKMHLCSCMSPVGEAFRRRCRMFPSLVNCCTIDWFTKWPPEALLSVAEQGLQPLGDAGLVEKISKLCVSMHQDVDVMTDRLYDEMRRYFYTTPSSYLDLLKLYLVLLDKKQQEIIRGRDRVSCGLRKLYETYEVVGVMEAQVREMEPILARKNEEGIALVIKLKIEQKAADEVKKAVMKDEAAAKIKAEEVKAIAEEAKADLALAMPAMEAAQNALKALNKADINELKAFQKPPALVRFVMEPVCILLGAKPDWDSTKKILADINFIRNLEEYDKDHIPDALLKKLKVYLTHKDFNPETVVKVSKVCRSMVLWVQAIDMYAKVFKVVEPKILKHKEAAAILKSVMAILRAKQKEVERIEQQLAKMLDELRVVEEEREKLQADVDQAAARLMRAGKLTQALAEEQTRWEDSVAAATNKLYLTTGDIIISSGCIAYFGAFPSNYRRELETKWVKQCKELDIPASDTFDLISIMADAYTVRTWNAQGLPRDTVSTENGILVTKAGRWPLTIDPQEQANRWIKAMEKESGLQITKLTDPSYLRMLENCIRLGWPMLLEDIGETIDAALAPVLLKQTYYQAGRLLIHLGDSDVEYDQNFRLYMTTKLANPHYLPETCIQVTLVNFTVTLSGLEDQLLADVVRLERPDLEMIRTDLIVRINADKATLLEIEDKILRLLYASTGNILDDEELIETLNESKETSEIINARLVETEATEISISAAREKYRSVATRGAVLYFAVAQLADVDPMYQFSLKYFNQIFNTVIEKSEKSNELEVRLGILYNEITKAVYRNVSRGLFERHKLCFSFMLNMAIFLNDKLVTFDEWNFILRGASGTSVVPPKKPELEQMTEQMWLGAHHLNETNPTFRGLVRDCMRSIALNIGTFSVVIHVDKTNDLPAETNWDETLTPFEKLMLIKCLREEKLVFAIGQYVTISLGREFIESPTIQLNTLYADTSSNIPLVFVLSTGSDPFGAFQRFATEMAMRDRVHSISLGQGQGPIAEKMITAAKGKGDWVFLQNCHLAASWMMTLEVIVAKLSSDHPPDPSFRLYLSSMPTKAFPVSVLQNSVKVTNEPPKGLKANVKRALIEIDQDFFEEHALGQDWRTMIFGICVFHGIIQERKKFGPLGWNITYEFNNSDRECALLNLQMFCGDGHIPWDALEYITSLITYGGRVTDMWDQRCLTTILKVFFSPPILEEGYTYSSSGDYYCPREEKVSRYQDYVETWPSVESPEVFGMNENANIAFETKESNSLITTILNVQPRMGGGGTGETPDQIVWRICDHTRVEVPKLIDKSEMNPSLLELDAMGQMHSLTTVLIHETDRFNRLLGVIHTSLNDLQKAIKGIVVMSEAYEEMYTNLLNNKVPAMWHKVGYNSLKSFGSWIKDLTYRVDFIEKWLSEGMQPSSWVSGLFFPQGLLTGALQSFARRYQVPIDALMFDFETFPILLNQELVYKFNKLTKKKQGKPEGDEGELAAQMPSAFGFLTIPEDGVNIHGLFIDAGRWDMTTNMLVDALPGQMNPPLPVMWFKPVTELPKPDPRYNCPLYKTAERAGILSTTGHSTNFVLPVLLETDKPEDYWIIQGTALLTQVTD